jgi:hypothetical protein
MVSSSRDCHTRREPGSPGVGQHSGDVSGRRANQPDMDADDEYPKQLMSGYRHSHSVRLGICRSPTRSGNEVIGFCASFGFVLYFAWAEHRPLRTGTIMIA